MKKFTIILAFMLFATLTTKATQWTVSNDANTPAQYHSLQTAITDAAAGDTLLIGPSVLNSSGYPVSYGSIDLYVNLVLIGSGDLFPDGATTSAEKKVTLLGNINLYANSASSSASGSKIIGIQCSHIYLYGDFSGSTYATGGIDNVLIERCKMSYINLGHYYGFNTYSNDTIRNCIITTYIYLYNYSTSNAGNKFEGISIENNIFDGAYIYGAYKISEDGSSLDSAYVRNNLFLNRTSACFNQVPHLVVENNIFWKSEPTVTNTPTGVTFNNNLCYNTTASMPGTGNIGSGNINNSNPLFVNFPAQGAGFSCSHNYNLGTSSPAIDAGTDGSDIGITGGISPFDYPCAGPKVPTIKYITMPSNASSVPQGGTLNVTFKAKNKD